MYHQFTNNDQAKRSNKNSEYFAKTSPALSNLFDEFATKCRNSYIVTYRRSIVQRGHHRDTQRGRPGGQRSSQITGKPGLEVQKASCGVTLPAKSGKRRRITRITTPRFRTRTRGAVIGFFRRRHRKRTGSGHYPRGNDQEFDIQGTKSFPVYWHFENRGQVSHLLQLVILDNS